MAIPSRGIGWGTEENLLWQISKQIEGLTCVAAGGCGSLTTTTTTTLPVYKVFTALLTQSGTSNPDAINNDSLVIGTTYEILNTDGNTVDFTNVGAPNNLVGTSFIATGTTPTSWGQTNNGLLGFNTGAVIAVILENTIGNMYFSYNGNGSAALESSALFTGGRTSVTVATPMDGVGQIVGSAGGAVVTDNVIVLQYRELNNIPTNDLLLNTLIEVRVYN
jgi:hypothetical protein